MALVKCKECGEKVSTKAKVCPNCGAKTPKKTSLFTWIILIFIVFVIYAVSKAPSTPVKSGSYKKPASQTTATKAKITKPSWGTTSSKDKMTGKKSSYASSPTVAATKRMGFPYSDVKAWLGVGCDATSEWAYIGFNKAPNLSDTETKDGYNLIRTRVKWGDKVVNTTLTQKWGASFIHFDDDKPAISNIVNYSSALLELKWHGEQGTYFEFSLKGSSAALKKIRKECSKY